MFTLRSPIPKKYMNKRNVCIVNQLFGENKNRLFYGPKGHQGIDFKTKGRFMYFFHNLLRNTMAERGAEKAAGLIPIHATHDGYLIHGFNDDKVDGVYTLIESEDGKYRTLNFHLDKVRVWKDDEKITGHELRRGANFVKAGTVIGWGGNTGRYTTGAHDHFELRQKINGVWVRIDPMPYFRDNVVYQRYRGLSPSDWFYKGEKITKEKAKSLLETL